MQPIQPNTPPETVQDTPRLIKTCSIWRALNDIGDVPTLLILETVWLGERQFKSIQTRTKLPKSVVSDRLKKLIAADIVFKEPYSQKPLRYEYRFTPKGLDLEWVAMMLLRFEKKWSTKTTKFDVQLVHTACGSPTNPEPICGHCKQVIKSKDLEWKEGPGVGLMEASYIRRRQNRSRDNLSELDLLYTDSVEILGDRWASLILRSIFTNIRRYDDILNDTAIATNILSERLNWLVENNVLTEVLYQTRPDRFEYWLTNKGYDYYTVLLMLMRWGDKYYGSTEGPPVLLHHKICGNELDPIVGCSHCKEPLISSELKQSRTDTK